LEDTEKTKESKAEEKAEQSEKEVHSLILLATPSLKS
jgi:hypothetical protein